MRPFVVPGAIAASIVLVAAGCFGGDGGSKGKPAPAKLTVSRTAQLATIRPDGGGLRVLGPASNFSPAPAPSWSPRGNRIVFVFQRCATCRARLSILSGKGRVSSVERAVGGDPSWSPDGRLVAYTRREEIDRELVVLNLAGGPRTEPADAENASHPDWFPDGSEIVFAAEVSERLHLFRVRRGAGGEQQLTTSGFFDDPTVSPDGRRLAFACLSESVNWDLCVSNAWGGGIHRILRWPGNERNPVFSPEGDRLVFSSDRDSRVGERALYVLDLKSGTVGRITNPELDAGEPDWSPDGRTIVFALRRVVGAPARDR